MDYKNLHWNNEFCSLSSLHLPSCYFTSPKNTFRVLKSVVYWFICCYYLFVCLFIAKYSSQISAHLLQVSVESCPNLPKIISFFPSSLNSIPLSCFIFLSILFIPSYPVYFLPSYLPSPDILYICVSTLNLSFLCLLL